MKKVVGVLISLSLVLGLAACDAPGGSSSGKGVDSAAKSEIQAAAKKLSDTYTNYIISTNVEFAGNATEYIEVVKGEDIYTEFSVSEDGGIGEVSYGSSDTISYALADWTHDGVFYSFGHDDDGNSVIYKFPASYATKYAYDREAMWVNRMLEKAISIEPYDDLELTLAGEQETYKAYRIEVPSDVVQNFVLEDSLCVYSAIKDEEKKGSNIDKLCDFYIEDFKLQRAMSDGRVVVGIDQDGILKFMSLEVGGLGTTMYITKAVVDVRNPNARDLPDFSSAVPLVSTMTDLADFIAQYPDYDSAMKALQEEFATSTEDDATNLPADMTGSDLEESEGVDTSAGGSAGSDGDGYAGDGSDGSAGDGSESE